MHSVFKEGTPIEGFYHRCTFNKVKISFLVLGVQALALEPQISLLKRVDAQ
jgi:hypothetical protein